MFATRRASLLLLVALCHLAQPRHRAQALDNGLVRTPWMGWSAWEVFRCTSCEQDPTRCVGEQLVMETADRLVADGFAAVGYRIVWVDDCWALRKRNASGALVPDPSRWPRGIKSAIDYVHEKGLLFGLYGDIGTATCEGFPGNQGHFEQDAAQLAAWGVDAYKVDGCNADTHQMNAAYPALGRALNRTGRPIIYSCSWPDYLRSSSLPIDWGLLASTCNSWRVFWDVQAGQYAPTQDLKFSCVDGALEFFATGSTEAAAPFSPTCPGDWNAHQHPAAVSQMAMSSVVGPGSFSDADMLPIGTNYTMSGGRVVASAAFTVLQAQAAMALWAVLPSPLMMGADLRALDRSFQAIWLNKGLIGVNQDPLGRPGVRVVGNASECQIWRRQLSGGRVNVVLYNNGRGSCTVPPPPWTGPFPGIYTDADCPDLGCHPGASVTRCEAMCNLMDSCNAFNIDDRGCCLRSCAAQNLTDPRGSQMGTSSYRMRSVRPTNASAVMRVTWSQLALQTGSRWRVTELVTGGVLGSNVTGEVAVSVPQTGAASLLLQPIAPM